MRLIGLFVLALPLLPLGAMAQPATKTKGLADCAALAASMPELITEPDSVIEDVEGGCRATHVRFAVSQYLNYGMDEVTLLSPDLLKTYPAEEVFVSADLDIKGARVMPQTGSPLQDYIVGLSIARMDLRLAYTSDPVAMTSDIRFSFGSSDLGHLEISAFLSGFDNADVDFDRLQRLDGRLERLDVTLEDNGLFAIMFAPSILSMMNPDEDPRPTILTTQEAIVAALAGLPETTLDEDSVSALSALVRAFPDPKGNWTFDLESPGGLALSDLTSGDLPRIVAALAGAKVMATGILAP